LRPHTARSDRILLLIATPILLGISIAVAEKKEPETKPGKLTRQELLVKAIQFANRVELRMPEGQEVLREISGKDCKNCGSDRLRGLPFC
jgi:hypothetical protein